MQVLFVRLFAYMRAVSLPYLYACAAAAVVVVHLFLCDVVASDYGLCDHEMHGQQ